MKTVFSGVAPSGTIHLGNYLGAIKNWVELQKDHQCIFCVVDLHAITVPQEPEKLRQKILEVAAIYLAAGIDQEKSIIFVQSHNPDHTELTWILNTTTRMSDLLRMPPFKEKAGIQYDLDKIVELSKNMPKRGYINIKEMTYEKAGFVLLKEFIYKINRVSVGLFDYPVLMASDILLYNTEIVPVGEDQEPHVELARTLAKRFNQQYGEIFKTPQVMVRKEGARIMGLDDPFKKMSKSASSPQNYIALTDSPDIIKDKIKRAITDSGKKIKYDPASKPAISNLLMIYSLVSDKPIKELESQYKNHTSYAEFKNDLAMAVIAFLQPFQEKYNELIAKPEYIKQILDAGATRARKISAQTLNQVKKKIGLA